jgi:hypothetical protein
MQMCRFKTIRKRTIARNLEKTHEDACENFIAPVYLPTRWALTAQFSRIALIQQAPTVIFRLRAVTSIDDFFKLIARANL